MMEIEKDNFSKQRDLSFNNIMYYSDQQLPEFEESLIKFSNRTTKNVHHYTILYLNRLIHGILTLEHKIYKGSLEHWAEWTDEVSLLTFSVSDLLRCKCVSKEKEIIRIYKEI